MKNLSKNLLIFCLGLALVGGVAFAYNGTANVVVEGDYIEASNNDNLGGFFSPDIEGLKEINATIAKTAVTASTTLRDTDSGTTYFLSASGTEITLPAVHKGLRFRFVINGASTDANYVIKSSEGDNIEGSVIVAGAVVGCDDADQLNFVTDGENLGDFVELISDGTNWFPISSGVLTASKLTCTG